MSKETFFGEQIMEQKKTQKSLDALPRIVNPFESFTKKLFKSTAPDMAAPSGQNEKLSAFMNDAQQKLEAFFASGGKNMKSPEELAHALIYLNAEIGKVAGVMDIADALDPDQRENILKKIADNGVLAKKIYKKACEMLFPEDGKISKWSQSSLEKFAQESGDEQLSSVLANAKDLGLREKIKRLSSSLESYKAVNCGTVTFEQLAGDDFSKVNEKEAQKKFMQKIHAAYMLEKYIEGLKKEQYGNLTVPDADMQMMDRLREKISGQESVLNNDLTKNKTKIEAKSPLAEAPKVEAKPIKTAESVASVPEKPNELASRILVRFNFGKEQAQQAKSKLGDKLKSLFNKKENKEQNEELLLATEALKGLLGNDGRKSKEVKAEDVIYIMGNPLMDAKKFSGNTVNESLAENQLDQQAFDMACLRLFPDASTFGEKEISKMFETFESLGFERGKKLLRFYIHGQKNRAVLAEMASLMQDSMKSNYQTNKKLAAKMLEYSFKIKTFLEKK